MTIRTTNILVIGSSGKLARFIINEIIGSFGIESLSISDYKTERLHALQKELKEKYGKAPSATLIDSTSFESVSHGIEDADYVIVPVSQRQPLIQEACIQQGKACLDVSVSEEIIDEVLRLQTAACHGKSLILMAAGLFPGLSGIIAKAIHENDPDAIGDIGLIQSRNGVAGKTGIADMLQLFNRDVEYLTSSGARVKKGFSYSRAFQLDSRFGTKDLRLANFIERKYLQQRLHIRSNYWSAFDDERFNKLIALLRAIGLLSLFESPKYRLKLAQFISKKKEVATEETIGIIGQTDETNRFYLSLESDYAATARCVTAYVEILNRREGKEYGVFFPFELFELKEVLQNFEVTTYVS